MNCLRLFNYITIKYQLFHICSQDMTMKAQERLRFRQEYFNIKQLKFNQLQKHLKTVRQQKKKKKKKGTV